MRNSGYARVQNDFYQEPRWIVDALLDVETMDGVSWDPSCGRGNIPIAMQARGLDCWGSDIADGSFGQSGVDFFEAPDRAVNVVTNPPFGVIEPYIRRALEKTTGKVCILARLALLEAQCRQTLFRTTPLARVWVSSRRVSIPPGNSTVPAKGGSIAYGWFVWDHSFFGSPTIGWL